MIGSSGYPDDSSHCGHEIQCQLLIPQIPQISSPHVPSVEEAANNTVLITYVRMARMTDLI